MPADFNLTFRGSYPNVKQSNEASDLTEIAFAGKSNVGKSSLINALAGRRNLVKVSATPGKTRLINFFKGPQFYLVDLPGFGYAKVSKTQRSQFESMLKNYFADSLNLKLVCFLKDSRRDWDNEELAWLDFISDHAKRPLAIILTKVDKLNQSGRAKLINKTCKSLGLEPGQVIPTSTQKKIGIEALRDFLLQNIPE